MARERGKGTYLCLLLGEGLQDVGGGAHLACVEVGVGVREQARVRGVGEHARVGGREGATPCTAALCWMQGHHLKGARCQSSGAGTPGCSPAAQ